MTVREAWQRRRGVVWKFDRLGRSTKDLINLVDIRERRVLATSVEPNAITDLVFLNLSALQRISVALKK